MMQHLDFSFPSHRDSWANHLQRDAQHGGETRREERPVSSSHTSRSNQSQIVWQLIVKQATWTQLQQKCSRLHWPPRNCVKCRGKNGFHMLSCNLLYLTTPPVNSVNIQIQTIHVYSFKERVLCCKILPFNFYC